MRWSEVARRVVSDGGDRNALGVELERIDVDEMETSEVPPEAVERYRRLCPVKESSAGLFRYCSLNSEILGILTARSTGFGMQGAGCRVRRAAQQPNFARR